MAMSGRLLAHIIHDGFYCNRRYAATTSLMAGGLAAQSVNILFQVCFLPLAALRARLAWCLAVAVTNPLNNAGLQPEIQRMPA